MVHGAMVHGKRSCSSAPTQSCLRRILGSELPVSWRSQKSRCLCAIVRSLKCYTGPLEMPFRLQLALMKVILWSLPNSGFGGKKELGIAKCSYNSCFLQYQSLPPKKENLKPSPYLNVKHKEKKNITNLMSQKKIILLHLHYSLICTS